MAAASDATSPSVYRRVDQCTNEQAAWCQAACIRTAYVPGEQVALQRTDGVWTVCMNLAGELVPGDVVDDEEKRAKKQAKEAKEAAKKATRAHRKQTGDSTETPAEVAGGCAVELSVETADAVLNKVKTIDALELILAWIVAILNRGAGVLYIGLEADGRVPALESATTLSQHGRGGLEKWFADTLFQRYDRYTFSYEAYHIAYVPIVPAGEAPMVAARTEDGIPQVIEIHLRRDAAVTPLLWNRKKWETYLVPLLDAGINAAQPQHLKSQMAIHTHVEAEAERILAAMVHVAENPAADMSGLERQLNAVRTLAASIDRRAEGPVGEHALAICRVVFKQPDDSIIDEVLVHGSGPATLVVGDFNRSKAANELSRLHNSRLPFKILNIGIQGTRAYPCPYFTIESAPDLRFGVKVVYPGKARINIYLGGGQEVTLEYKDELFILPAEVDGIKIAYGAQPDDPCREVKLTSWIPRPAAVPLVPQPSAQGVIAATAAVVREPRGTPHSEPSSSATNPNAPLHRSWQLIDSATRLPCCIQTMSSLNIPLGGADDEPVIARLVSRLGDKLDSELSCVVLGPGLSVAWLEDQGRFSAAESNTTYFLRDGEMVSYVHRSVTKTLTLVYRF